MIITLLTGYHCSREGTINVDALTLIFIAVCIYRLVMISIKRSETAQKSALEIWDKFSPIQNAVEDKIQFENFFGQSGKNFFGLNFVSDCICLRLNFVSDWICLRLNFVSDYIPQLYFVCNLLIYAGDTPVLWPVFRPLRRVHGITVNIPCGL